MIRLQDNPPLTLPSAAPLDNASQRWTAAYCKPRQEKAFAWDLLRKEVPYFLPMVMRETSSGGRRRRNLYPMFKSYVFLTDDEELRLAALKTERIVTFVKINEAQQESFRQEIASLELGLRTSPDSIELYPRLVEGAWVRVIAGPMTGAQGTILSADHKTKLVLGVTLMGSSATVEIPSDFVEPCQRDKDSQPSSTVTVVYDLSRKQRSRSKEQGAKG